MQAPQRLAPVPLPVGPNPGWELEEANDSPDAPQLRSVPESLVVFESLRQSRNKWLFSTFPKFSAKARGGKPPDVVPPPHAIKAHGRYELRIGPHIFPNTAFYEVHYLPQVPAFPTHPSSESALGQATSSHGVHDRGSYPQSYTAELPATALTSRPAIVQTAPISTSGNVMVTPDMVSQVNIASETNPTLKNLLHLAGSGRATPDQIRTLGLLIQSLNAAQQPNGHNVAITPPAPPPIAEAVRQFDIVIEFPEKPSDRWIIPRGPVVCERIDSGDAQLRKPHVCLTLCIPFPNEKASHFEGSPSQGKATDEVPPQLVSFRLSGVSQCLWDLMVCWAGGEEGIENSRKTLREIAHEAPQRSYLQHQLPEGPLLEQIQSAVAPPYGTKPVMPSNPDARPKRRPSRKTTSEHKLTTDRKAPPVKRRQSVKAAISSAVTIACRACGKTDVPLLMGGRYCRVCIESGKAIDDTPHATPGYHTFRAFEGGSSARRSAHRMSIPHDMAGFPPNVSSQFLPPTSDQLSGAGHMADRTSGQS